jgi:Zinc dependent phospholipase C
MKKYNFLKTLFVLIIYKWSWPTHANIAEDIYNSLPVDIRINLNVEKMKDGSNDPDQKFKDTATHHYPSSYRKATKWLEDGKRYYNQKNYDNASYCFGVATHYISDTFSAPHCVSKESGKDHHNYEIIADTFTPKITYLDGDLDTIMKKGVEQGKSDWKQWKKTQDRSIIQAGVDRGASAAYTAIRNTLS